MKEIIKFTFARPVKVQEVVDKVAGEVTINKVNRDGGEFGAPRSYGPHKGLDFLSYLWRVEASGAGIVVYSGFIPGKEEKPEYGNTVIIEHTTKAGEYDNYVYTLYAHLKENPISEGTKVEQDDRIGESSNTGTKEYYHHKRTNRYPNKDPLVETAAFKKCQTLEKVKVKKRGEIVGTNKVFERCKAIKQYETTGGFHLHFEVIVSPKKIDWNNDKWPKGNTFRINPETALAEGVEVKYQEPERQVTDADRKKFGERLRIKEKRNARGRLVSHDVWVKNEHVDRLDNRTKEIKLSIPMSKFFALVDGPKPMKRHGEADFDVKLNS